MSRWALPRWAAALRSQWTGNRRLRWGLLAIGGIVWLQALLLLGDVAQAWHLQSASLREDVQRVRPLGASKVWPARADEARQQLNALQTMLWHEAEIGLAEAAVQDWVRGVAAKSRLGIREFNVARSTSTSAAAAAPAASAPSQAAGVQPVALRLSVELDRLALTGFLAELARNEQVVVVDRMVLRPAAQPPSAELDLRILVALRRPSQ